MLYLSSGIIFFIFFRCTVGGIFGKSSKKSDGREINQEKLHKMLILNGLRVEFERFDAILSPV